MAEAKKFDPVTIIGLALALALFFGGQWWMTTKQRENQQRAQAEQAKLDEERKRAEAEKPPVAPSGDGQKPVLTNGEKPAPNPSPAPAEAETPAAPDVTVKTDELTLTFTANGGSVRKALLNNAMIDPSKGRIPENLGMEILSEIEPKKRSFDITRLDIGNPDLAKQSERFVFETGEGEKRAPNLRVWKLESDSGDFDKDGVRKIVYSLTLPQKYTLTKTFSIQKARRYVTVDVAVKNDSGAPVSWMYTLLGQAGLLLDGPPEKPKSSPYVTIQAQLAGRSAAANGQRPDYPEVVNVDAATAAKANEKSYVSREENLWGSVKNRFFTAMFISLNPTQLNKLSAVEIKHKTEDDDKRLIEPNIGIAGQRKLSGTLESGQTSAADRYALYLGPTNEEQFEQVESELKPDQPLYLVEAVQYCDIFSWRWPRVDWIAGKLMLIFRHLSNLFGNYGIAVIFLTILIKLCLHPTQRKATISMNKMQKLQPEIKKLQDKYKNRTSNEDKMRLYQEQQDLFKKAGASPAGGCLPMLIQIPILSALYGIFNHAFEIRGAQFLWIRDLSQPDHLATLTFWPHTLNLLPLIYLVLQLLQMKFAPQAPKTDDPQQEMNRKMMGFMPIMFTFMFYGMPAGLMIYFATSAIFSIIEAWYIRKFLIKDPPEGSAALATA
jgi:YidC/Oxa1 family membrane protein insertase